MTAAVHWVRPVERSGEGAIHREVVWALHQVECSQCNGSGRVVEFLPLEKPDVVKMRGVDCEACCGEGFICGIDVLRLRLSAREEQIERIRKEIKIPGL